MKKTLALILTLIIIGTGLISCAGTGNDGKISVVCTIFPEYDWVRSIISGCDDIELTLLIDNGVDLHNYKPTVKDLAKITSCDLFVYVGGESDSWVKDALAQATNKDMKVLALLDLLGERSLEEEEVEGMQEEEEHGRGEEEEEDGGPEYDEHIWLSLRNAKHLCSLITDELSKLAPDGAGTFRSNYVNYAKELDALDKEFRSFTETSEDCTIVVADRFPFRYLAHDYKIKYFAAFSGCSAETEASFQTIATLANKVNEYSIKHLVITESSDGKIARTVKETSGADCDIIVMNSIQAVTGDQIKQGATYLTLMRGNLEALKRALQN